GPSSFSGGLVGLRARTLLGRVLVDAVAGDQDDRAEDRREHRGGQHADLGPVVHRVPHAEAELADHQRHREPDAGDSAHAQHVDPRQGPVTCLWMRLRGIRMIAPRIAASTEAVSTPTLAQSYIGAPMLKLSSLTSSDTVKPMPATADMPSMSIQVRDRSLVALVSVVTR